MTTLAHRLQAWATLRGSAVAFRQVDRQMAVVDQCTWGELALAARRVGAELLDAGVLPGEPVLVAAREPLAYVRAIFGCWWAGAVALPLPHSAGRRASQLTSLAQHVCRPRFGLREAGLPPERSVEPGSALTWLSAEPGQGAAMVDEPLCIASATALVQLSSGSTAAPKAAQLLHNHLAANQEIIQRAFDHDASARIVGWLPLNHDMGLIGNVLQNVHLGAVCTLLSPRDFAADPLCWPRAVSAFSGTTSGGPDSAYAIVAQLAGSGGLAGTPLSLCEWRVAFNGAEPIRAETLRRFADAFAPWGFRPSAQLNCYGLAEASLMVTAGAARNAAGDLPPDELVHSGRPAAGVTVRIVDPVTRRGLADGREGEVWVSGPSVAVAYWANEEATASQLRAVCADDPQGPRFLRTGDLGLIHEGCLVVRGRLDDRFSVLGRNVDAVELEQCIAGAVPGLQPERVAAFQRLGAAGSAVGLGAVIEGRTDVTPAEARDRVVAAVGAALGLPLLAVGFARAGQLPRTTSGKLRRSECARLLEAGVFAQPALEAAAQEGSPLAVLSRVLGRTVRSQELQGGWRALGGDSMSAARCASQLRAAGLEISADALLSTPTVADALRGAALAAPDAIDADSAAAQASMTDQPFGELASRLLRQSQLDGGVGASHLDWAAWLGGKGAPALDACMRRWAQMHASVAALRIVCPGPDVDVEVGALVEGGSPYVLIVDATGWSDDEVVSDMRLRRAEAFGAGALLFRLVAYRRGAGDRAAVLVVAHHAVCDLASMRLLQRMLLDAPPPQAADASAGAALHRATLAWERRAAARAADGASSGALQIPTDRPAPVWPDFRGADLTRALGPKRLLKLAQAASAADCSVPELLVALWGLTLMRMGDAAAAELDLAVDLRPLHGLEDVVGCGVGVATLQFGLTGALALRELVRDASGQIRAAVAGRPLRSAHAASGSVAGPASELRSAFRWIAPGDAALLGHAGTSRVAQPEGGDEIRVEPLRLPTDAVQWSLELTVSALDAGGATLHLAYAVARFEAATARAILDAYVSAVEATADLGVDGLASRWPVTDALRTRQLHAWSRGRGSGRAPATLGRLLWRQGGRPDALAVVDRAPLVLHGHKLPAELTRAALFSWSMRVAQQLEERGVGPGAVVGLALPRSSLLVVAVLAVLRRGAAFAPLIPADGPARRNAMLRDIDCRLVLAAGPLKADVPVVDLGQAYADAPLPSGSQGWVGDDADLPGGAASDLAYAMFTSGSTGRPKAVQIEHGAIAARLQAMVAELELTPADTIAHKTSPTFDVAMWEILLPLATGARMVIAAPGVERDADALDRLIVREGVSIVHFVPSMLSAFLAGRPQPCKGGRLRRVICSGEALTVPLRDRALLAFPGAELWNYYGPTEAAIDVCIHRASRHEACSPIGRPVDDTRLVLLDRWGGEAPPGACGEIHIGGRQLARGYAGSPELTAAAFRLREGERLYATGDRARWLQGGVLEHLGRRDDQWKIRGQRIERAEIESAIRALPGVADAAVVGRPQPDGGLLVEAHVVPLPGPKASTAAELVEASHRLLPSVMQPARLAVVPSLPLNASGKVDRKALPVLAPPESQGGEDSADAVELALCDCFAQALQRAAVGPEDGFFAMGGDSLRAIRMVALARERGLDVSVADLYGAPTARALAGELRCSRRGGEAAQAGAPAALDLPVMRVGEPFPLGSAQRSLLFLSEADTGYEVYVTTLRLQGPFDDDLLACAVQGVVDRHPFLRLACDPLALPEPVQVLLERVEIGLDVRDARALDPDAQLEELGRFVAEERRRRFDWRQAPLLRVTAHRWSEEQFQLTLSDPSMDGWCVATVLTEIVHRYAAMLTGVRQDDAPAPEHFRAFVELERRTTADPASQAYWRGVLAGRCASDALRRGGLHQQRQARRRVLRLPGALRWRLESTARLTGRALRHVLLAAHAVSMWRLRGRAGGWVCAEVTGRLEVDGGDADLGVYNNIVPVLVEPAGATWRDLVAAASEGERALLPHRRYPYAALRAMAGGDLADSLFVHTNFRLYRALSDGPVRLVDMTATDQTYVPLTAHFTLDPLSEDLLVIVDHDENVHDGAAVGGYLQALREALGALAVRPCDDVCPVPSPVPRDAQPGWSVVDAFMAQARRAPDAVALEQDGRQVTYGLLLQRCAAVAGSLVSRGLQPEMLVGLDLPFGPDLVTGMLGCLLAGVAFVPLNSKAAGGRRVAVLDAARPTLVLHGPYPGEGEGEGECDATARLDFDTAVACRPVAPRRIEHDVLAYVLFTSGSTGRPKGVAIGRRQMGAYLSWAAQFYAFGAGRGAGVVTGGDVDMSITPLFGPLVTGRSVVFASAVGDMASLKRLAGDRELGVLKLTPSHLDAMAAADALPQPEQWPAELILGGEDIAPRHLDLLDTARCAVINEYGPTETTVGCLAARLPNAPRRARDVTLGRPTGGAHPRLVDPFGGTPPPGLPGEIVVRGAQVARGYLGEPARTAALFVPAPGGRREYRTGDHAIRAEDGAWRYVGRIDRQVKINGHRVELAEVEELLLRQPGVASAVCIALAGADGRQRLVAGVVPRPGAAVDPSALRTGLASTLAAAVVPARIAVIKELPLNPAGKVDREALVRLLGTVTPEQAWLEAMLARIERMSDDEVAAELTRRGGAGQEVAR
jgi:nonribosomal peptide synthetase protein BlmVI